MEPNLLPPSLDTWTTVFLLAAGHGIFLSAMLYMKRKGNRKANFLLGTFILLFALMLVDFIGYWTRYNMYFPEFKGIYSYLVLLFGPLLYLYIRQVNEKELRRIDMIHFLPAALYVLLRKGLGWASWFPSAESYFYFQSAIYLSHMAAYGIVMKQYLDRNKGNDPQRDSNIDFIRQWQRNLLRMYWGYVAGWLTYYMVVNTPFFSLVFDYGIALSMSFFIYAVGYIGYRQPVVFDWIAGRKPFRKYQNSSLTERAAVSLQKKLKRVMDKERPYLDNDLRLNKLARQMNVSPHHLSQVINNNYGKSFSDYINDYRVEAVMSMLNDPSYSDAYLINIAYEAGFNNKTTFNKMFKERTGLSPSQYRRKLDRKNSRNSFATNN